MLCFIRTRLDGTEEMPSDQCNDYIHDQGYTISEVYPLATLNLQEDYLEVLSRDIDFPYVEWSTTEKLNAWLQANIGTPDYYKARLADKIQRTQELLDNIKNKDTTLSSAEESARKLRLISDHMVTSLTMQQAWMAPMDVTVPGLDYCAHGLESLPGMKKDIYVGTAHSDDEPSTHIEIVQVTVDY